MKMANVEFEIEESAFYLGGVTIRSQQQGFPNRRRSTARLCFGRPSVAERCPGTRQQPTLKRAFSGLLQLCRKQTFRCRVMGEGRCLNVFGSDPNRGLSSESFPKVCLESACDHSGAAYSVGHPACPSLIPHTCGIRRIERGKSGGRFSVSDRTYRSDHLLRWRVQQVKAARAWKGIGK